MTQEAAFWLMIASLILTAIAAIGVKALREFSHHELGEICRKRQAPSLFREVLVWHDRVALGLETLQVLASVVLVFSSMWWAWLNWSGGLSNIGLLAISGGLGLAALLLLGVSVWIPWAFTHLWAEYFLFHTWRLLRFVSTVLVPFVMAARFIDGFAHRLAGRQREPVTEDSIEEEIRAIVSQGQREGLLEADAREMIEGVMELSDVDVAHIMTPRTDIVYIPVTMTISEAAEFIATANHTRFPVFDQTRDDIIGVLYTKDLLPELIKAPKDQQPLANILRKPYFVPEIKRVDDLLEEFQRTRNHLAVALDEYGGVSGLVSIEDVLEEIVGEIVDEYDEDLVDGIRRVDDATSEALARVHIDEVNDRLGLQLPDDGDFDTIGGFVFSELGRIPDAGDLLMHENVKITVLEATRRRIERVKIEVLNQPTVEAD
ncbi:MAG: hemolysin family protein [Pirellulales bacterium]|nr:hemolysin family protein [Pirellulales bacterium]